jgi:hypothetical protein
MQGDYAAEKLDETKQRIAFCSWFAVSKSAH